MIYEYFSRLIWKNFISNCIIPCCLCSQKRNKYNVEMVIIIWMYAHKHFMHYFTKEKTKTKNNSQNSLHLLSMDILIFRFSPARVLSVRFSFFIYFLLLLFYYRFRCDQNNWKPLHYDGDACIIVGTHMRTYR